MEPTSNGNSSLTGTPDETRVFTHLANFIENSLDAIVAFNSREQIVFWNLASERTFGWTASEARGKSSAELFWPANTIQEQDEQKHRKLKLDSGEIVQGEHSMLRKDGSQIWIKYSIHGIIESGSVVSGYVAVYRDITERKQAEENLRRFELLSEHSRDIILFLRREDGRILEANAAAMQAYGYSRDELLALTIRDLRAHHTRSLIAEQLAQTDAEGILFETVHQRKDGSTFPVEVNSTGAMIGGVRTLVHIVRDITMREQSEEQLERSNQRLNEILVSIQDDFYVLDRNWKFVFTSRSFTSKIGKEPKDFVGNNIWEMFPKHVGGVLYENFHAAMEKRELRRFEIPGKYTDAWYRMTAFPSAEGITVLGTDITDRRRMEREIESLARFPQENPNPVLRIYPDGVIAFANSASDDLLRLWNCEVGERLPESEHKLIVQTLESHTAIEHEVSCAGYVYSLIFTPIPEIGYVNIYGRDITERKRAEDALRESEERYRHLVKYAPAGIYEIDVKTSRFIEVNDLMCQILGYTREELLSTMPEELLDEEGRARFRIRMLQTLAGEKVSEQTEYRVRAKDGNEIWAILNTTINYENGEAKSVSVIAHDITERKRAEETLTRQRELLQRVIENIPVLLVMWDPYLERFTLNRHAENVLGWTTSDANEGDFMSKVYPDTAYRAEVSAYMQSLAEGFRELLTTAKNGEQIPIDWANIWLTDNTMIGIGMDLRERKRAEESLRARNEEIDALLQVSPIAFFVAYDPECKRITANPAGYRLVELPQDPSLNISKSAPAEEQPTYRVFRDGVELASQDLPMQVAARMGVDVVDESLELRFEDGSSKYFYSYARPLLGEDGHPRGAIAAMLDITERKQAERALLESEGKLRAAVKNSSFVLAQFDRELRYQWIYNPHSDFSVSEILGKRDDELNDSEGQRKLVVLKQQVVESGQGLREEVAFKLSDTTRTYDFTIEPIIDANGVVVGGTSAALDVTRSKQVEEKLRESEENFRTLAEAVPSIVWTAAPDGTLTYTNEYWNKYFGIRSEKNSIHWGPFVHPDDHERADLAWTQAIKSASDEYFIEVRLRRYDGLYRWFQTRAIPVRDSQGNVMAWYGVSTDIHDRIEALHAMRESQQQLQFLNETLEQKVNEQTVEVRRLASELTKVEQRERQRVAHILHEDLQQRLYAVKMQLSLLEAGLELDTANEMELVETNKQVDEILSLTRSLTVELSPPVLRDEGLAQALEWLAIQMDTKQGLHVEIQAEEPFASTEKAIQVLLFNCVRELLFNIVKHAEVKMAKVVLQRSDSNLRIEVRDDGKGFDVAALTGSNQDKYDEDERKRWSFGLPTLRHQLSLFGGTMDIESEPGAGTCIIITIPYF